MILTDHQTIKTLLDFVAEVQGMREAQLSFHGGDKSYLGKAIASERRVDRQLAPALTAIRTLQGE